MNAAALDVDVIRRAWSRATSATPEEWTRTNRARGQCAVTACVVQDCLGGVLVRTTATYPDGRTEGHYATMIDHGVIIDLTESQFPDGTSFDAWEMREREYVLGYSETHRRYSALLQRLNEVRTLQRVQSIGVPM